MDHGIAFTNANYWVPPPENFETIDLGRAKEICIFKNKKMKNSLKCDYLWGVTVPITFTFMSLVPGTDDIVPSRHPM